MISAVDRYDDEAECHEEEEKKVLASEKEKKQNEPRCIRFYSAIRAHSILSNPFGARPGCGFAIEKRSRGRWIPESIRISLQRYRIRSSSLR